MDCAKSSLPVPVSPYIRVGLLLRANTFARSMAASMASSMVSISSKLMRVLLSDREKERYFERFNVDGLLRGDYASRMQGYATARQNGWMSANDIRELENLDRIPAEEGGDLYLVNGNMLPLTKAGAMYGENEGSENK